jgi:hypothetical protein
VTHLSKLDRIRQDLTLAESRLERRPGLKAREAVERLRTLLAREEAIALKKHWGNRHED